MSVAVLISITDLSPAFTSWLTGAFDLYKTEGPDGVQMGGGGGRGGGITFCTRPRSINQFGLYIHKLIAKTLD